MDSEPPLPEFLLTILHPLTASTDVLLGIFLLMILIFLSALISGSEVAYFSLSPNDLHLLEDEKSRRGKRVLALRDKPRKLLATILISNNFINIAIVIVFNFVLRNLIGDEDLFRIAGGLQNLLFLQDLFSIEAIAKGINFIVSVIMVTFILVLFGEVTPKVYANLNNLRFARLMSLPLTLLQFIFGPVSRIMVKMSVRFEGRINQTRVSSSSTLKEDIDKAIDLTMGEGDPMSEAAILKSIIKFGDLSAKQIMKSRVDIVALDKETGFEEVLNVVRDAGYSRIPVYIDDLDNIEGILYVKDLVGHTDEGDDFNWQSLIRKNVLYVPESKKIDELLREFQSRRNHMAIVVDEYGGCSGIVTLEDIMEEIIGEIKDEFDEDQEVDYIQLADNNYIFDGKTLLNDICRIIGVKADFFDAVKGDADSLAGLMIEMTGSIPKQEKEVRYENIILKVISVNKKRIEKINLSLK
ncbi:MAG TPA: gliding motility-associated protein GldE [Saprospiraceae bacterium]|nr:gliding motility-associated protein GldE [Saprospiraceae bacterium]